MNQMMNQNTSSNWPWKGGFRLTLSLIYIMNRVWKKALPLHHCIVWISYRSLLLLCPSLYCGGPQWYLGFKNSLQHIPNRFGAGATKEWEYHRMLKYRCLEFSTGKQVHWSIQSLPPLVTTARSDKLDNKKHGDAGPV